MQTSYFGKCKDHQNAVAICRYPPKWWTGRWYPDLAPSTELMVARLEHDLGDEEFGLRYHAETLAKLDPQTVYDTLGENAILLCYEKDGFCHRHLVSAWFKMTIGKNVREVGKESKGTPLEQFGREECP